MSEGSERSIESLKPLSGKQIRFLRSLAHGLRASIVVGRNGITEDVVQAVRQCVDRRELVKVRIQKNDPGQRKALGHELAERTASHLVQVIGQIAVLYRPAPQDAEIPKRIQLPDALCS